LQSVLEDQRQRAEAAERRSAESAAETHESAHIPPELEEDDSFEETSPPYEAEARADTQDAFADTPTPAALEPAPNTHARDDDEPGPEAAQHPAVVDHDDAKAGDGVRVPRHLAGRYGEGISRGSRADNSGRHTNVNGNGGRSQRHAAVGTDRSKTDGSEWWYAVVSSRNPGRDVSDIDTVRAAGRRSAIDRAGMAAVEQHERTAGRHPEAQPPNNPGFDIASSNSAGETLRLIEVKSLTGGWGAGGLPKLTPTQWELALKERRRYWLYVVEYADSDAPVIHRIQDPAGAVTRYVVDPGWAVLGEPEGTIASSGETTTSTT
jgi:hypothetical protein